MMSPYLRLESGCAEECPAPHCDLLGWGVHHEGWVGRVVYVQYGCSLLILTKVTVYCMWWALTWELLSRRVSCTSLWPPWLRCPSWRLGRSCCVCPIWMFTFDTDQSNSVLSLLESGCAEECPAPHGDVLGWGVHHEGWVARVRHTLGPKSLLVSLQVRKGKNQF